MANLMDEVLIHTSQKEVFLTRVVHYYEVVSSTWRLQAEELIKRAESADKDKMKAEEDLAKEKQRIEDAKA